MLGHLVRREDVEPAVNDDAGQGDRDVMALDRSDVPFVSVADVTEDIVVQVESFCGFAVRRLLRPEGERRQEQQGCEQKTDGLYPMHTVTTFWLTSTKPPGQAISWLSDWAT